MVASRQVLPSRHVLISGRTHEIPDKLKLMGIALAGKDRLAIQHFSKDTANSPHVDSGGVLP